MERDYMKIEMTDMRNHGKQNEMQSDHKRNHGVQNDYMNNHGKQNEMQNDVQNDNDINDEMQNNYIQTSFNQNNFDQNNIDQNNFGQNNIDQNNFGQTSFIQDFGLDSAYIARCHRKLKELYAPFKDWYCIDTFDIEEESSSTALFKCELCGCSKVRFVHVMRHDEYFDDFKVGCICAGIMEGDLLAAKERDRLMKNRSKRKKNFIKRRWEENSYGGYSLKYKGDWININHSRFNQNHYGASCNGKSIWERKGQPITSFLAAVNAAFELVDPVVRIRDL